MTRSTIDQFGALLGQGDGNSRIIAGVIRCIVFGLCFVAVDAPAHINGLFQCGNRLFAHIAVAVFAVQSGGDMRAVVEMHEVGHLIDRHPIDWLVFLHK